LIVDATERRFQVELDGKPLKVLAIKSLAGEVLLFDDYVELIRQEARSEWQRWQGAARRLVPRASS
jgi:hypothetical protein